MMGLGLPDFLKTPGMLKSEREYEERMKKAQAEYFELVLVPNAVDWDPNFGKKRLDSRKQVCFKASTYQSMERPLFDGAKPVLLTWDNMRKPHKNDIVGPTITHNEKEVTWIYREAILPRGESLWLSFGNAKGECFFDGDVVIPSLCQYREGHHRPILVWMSYAPMEFFTQRAGIKHCSGRVCIGGYGMGWFLEQVAKKRSVKSIVVVERSPELLDWFARGHAERVSKETGTPIEIVCADVFSYLAEHHKGFDKIALDTFPSYGNNNAEDNVQVRDLLYPDKDYFGFNSVPLAGLKKKLWCWGSVKIGRQERIRYL